MMKYEQKIKPKDHDFFLFRTPMHFAAYNGYVEVIKLLVENGANHNLLTFDGRSAHDLALEQEQYETADYLSSL